MAKNVSVRTNVAKPPKKKKQQPMKPAAAPVAVVKKTGSPQISVERGTSSYKPTDVRTGHSAYGKESMTKPTPEFIKKAQRSGVETVVGKGGSDGVKGLTYAAGTRTSTPDKINVSTPAPKLEFKKPAQKKVMGQIKVKPKVKLKPMAMTYGTDHPTKGGGSKYVHRVRAKK
jgi:hypothetical protein